jgi:hypothetical protein
MVVRKQRTYEIDTDQIHVEPLMYNKNKVLGRTTPKC